MIKKEMLKKLANLKFKFKLKQVRLLWGESNGVEYEMSVEMTGKVWKTSQWFSNGEILKGEVLPLLLKII